MIGVLMIWVVSADLIVTRKLEGEVYNLTENSATLLVEGLILPTSAAAYPASNRLYISSQDSIYMYDLSNPHNLSASTLYSGGSPTSLTLDIWGNLYFADTALNCISVIYAGSTNVTVLYESNPVIQSPTVVALDDFNSLLYWGNGENGLQFGSVHVALKDPLQNGIGHLTNWLHENATYALTLSHNYVYVSTSSGVLQANKHKPKQWERVVQMLSSPRILAVSDTWGYISDLSTGALYRFQEGKSAADMSEVTWAPSGITHIFVLSCATLHLLGLLVTA